MKTYLNNKKNIEIKVNGFNYEPCKCFAMSHNRCTILTEKVCANEICTFFKPKGAVKQIDICESVNKYKAAHNNDALNAGTVSESETDTDTASETEYDEG